MLRGTGGDETFDVVDGAGINTSRALTWTWSSTITARHRVLAPGDPAIPLSAVMNGPAMGEFGTGVGGAAFAEFGRLLFPLNVRAAVDLFPPMAPEEGIVVVNLAHLRAAMDLAAIDGYALPNELWVDLDPSMPVTEQRALLASLQADGVPPVGAGAALLAVDVEGRDRDPTLQAAGSAILGVAFIAVLALCTVGFVVTMAVGARSRATEFAVLRAIGTSRGAILRSLLVEWAIVLAAGAAIGILVGRQVARIMLGFLNVTEEGDQVVPPFELRTDWVTLGVGLAALAAVVCASLLAVWVASMRRSPTTELRVTQ
jgi:hypothetical protein